MSEYKPWSPDSNRVLFNRQEVQVGETHSGVAVRYLKARRAVTLFGWYDHIVSIQAATVPLGDFLCALGVSERDLRAVMRVWRTVVPAEERK